MIIVPLGKLDSDFGRGRRPYFYRINVKGGALMLKRAACFLASMLIVVLAVSYPAFAIEYEDLPPEIQEYVDEVESSAYDAGCEHGYEFGYEDGFYDGKDERYEEYEEEYDDYEGEYDYFTGAWRGRSDNILGTIVTVGGAVIFFGFILYWIIRISIELLIDKIKERRKDREK